MRVDAIIERLKEKRAEVAMEALTQPASDNLEYEYGRAVGAYTGLTIAIESIEELLKEAAEAKSNI